MGGLSRCRAERRSFALPSGEVNRSQILLAVPFHSTSRAPRLLAARHLAARVVPHDRQRSDSRSSQLEEGVHDERKPLRQRGTPRR